MTLAGMNVNAVAFLAAHAASAQRLAQKAEVGEGVKALIQESGNAIHDLLSAGNRSGALTLDGEHVGLAQAHSASPSAAAGLKELAGAITLA